MTLLDLQRDFLGFLLDEPSDIPVAVGGSSGPGGGRLEKVKEGALAQGANQRLARIKTFLRPPGQALSAPFVGNGYGHEAAAVAAAVRAGQGQSAVMPLGESVEIMDLMDRARAIMKESAE